MVCPFFFAALCVLSRACCGVTSVASKDGLRFDFSNNNLSVSGIAHAMHIRADTHSCMHAYAHKHARTRTGVSIGGTPVSPAHPPFAVFQVLTLRPNPDFLPLHTPLTHLLTHASVHCANAGE